MFLLTAYSSTTTFKTRHTMQTLDYLVLQGQYESYDEPEKGGKIGET